jgi:hypothetical protein
MQKILIYYFGESYLYNVILVTIAILLTIIIMYTISNRIQNELTHIKGINIDKFLDTCQTGDIIITRWEHVDIGYRLFCKYCHVSMIYKNKLGEKFLIDTHPAEYDEDDTHMEFPRSGVNMYPLKERITNYQGTCYFLKLKIPHKIKNFDFNKYKDIPFSTDFRFSFLKNWFCNKFGIITTKTDNTMYCSELTGYILQDLGILSKKIKINTLSPDSFELLKVGNQNLYDKPLSIIVDENEIMKNQIKILEENLQKFK